MNSETDDDKANEDESRYSWKIATYIITGLSILTNLVLLLVLSVKKKHISGKTGKITNTIYIY